MELKSDRQDKLNDLEIVKLIEEALSDKNNFFCSTKLQIDAYLVDDLRVNGLYLGNYIFINQNASDCDGQK
jgi:hypothetical protein